MGLLRPKFIVGWLLMIVGFAFAPASSGVYFIIAIILFGAGLFLMSHNDRKGGGADG